MCLVLSGAKTAWWDNAQRFVHIAGGVEKGEWRN
jgi:hypothetical protein